VRHTTWSDLAKQIQSYHDAWAEAGHPGHGQVFVSAPTFLAETEERARSEPKESITHFYREQANLLEGAARLVDAETAARRMRRVDQLRSLRYEDGLRDHALVGTPDAIAERLKVLQREVGLSGISPSSIAGAWFRIGRCCRRCSCCAVRSSRALPGRQRASDANAYLFLYALAARMLDVLL
jgi:alkanesulfonate monooxygenase SsuD/methylene tetrahydromethanopterin reductase-like flavin-dependent oxidoreductase (luciferase family)